MGYADPFMLGPLGRMRPVPSPIAAGMAAPYRRIASEHRSLRGGTTVDVLGAVREWEFPLEYRTDAEARLLIARWSSPITTEALRMIDPLTPNRLSLDLASGGGVTGTTDGQGVAISTVTSRIFPDARPALLDGLLDGAFRWRPLAAPNDWYLTLDWRAPVQSGEALSFRGWLRGTGSVQPFVRRYDAANAYADAVIAPIALTSTWTEFAVDTLMEAGRTGAVVGLHVEAGDVDRTIDLMGPQFGLSDELPAGQWQPGGGGPVVVVTDFDHNYQRLGRRGMKLTIREM